jgi:hypothetical protein
MNTLVHSATLAHDADTVPALARPAATPWGAVACYAGIVLACVLGALVAAAVAQPTPHLVADTELAWLLRGMGLIKASMVVAALGVLAVRLRWPLPGAWAAGYGACMALLAASTVLIWQLSWIALAAAVFHLAGFMLLVLAWRDGSGLWETHRQQRRSAPQ